MKNFRKKVDEQSKGTITRKMFAQTQKYWLKMNNFKRKKSVNQKETGQRKRFSYDHMCLKPRDQKIQKFLPQLLFSAPGLHREKKTGDELFRWEPEQPTNENTKISTGEFFACLKVSSKWSSFSLGDSSKFSKTFSVVVQKSILIFFFVFSYFMTTVFGLWKLCFSSFILAEI